MLCKKCGQGIGENQICPNCGEQETKEKKTKKFPIKQIIICLILLFIVVGVALYFFLPIMSLKIKESYEYDEFIKEKFKLKSSISIKKDNTIWKLNGYEFYRGAEPDNFPVVAGKNKLIIKNGDLTKEYSFKITTNNSLAVNTDEKLTIDVDNLDYDGDGIPNYVEKEKKLLTYSNDSDEDGLYDNVELVMGLDPKKKDNYDKNRTFKVTQDNKNTTSIYLDITGKGNIANTFLDTESLDLGYTDGFILSDTVSLVTSNSEKPKKMTIYFRKTYSMSEENVIYDYNKATNELKGLKTELKDNYFSANVDYFNHIYFVGDKTKEPTGDYKNQISILIDNSGSMFSVDYVEEKSNITIKESEYKEYASDVDFKRLDFMNTLVERLGTNDYTYSVKGFTGNICDLIESSQDKEEIKSKIESLRTECQTFNGTLMSDTIRKAKSEFDFSQPGVKYIIVLTDGREVASGLFGYVNELANYELENYRKQGIRIITIGLGSNINSEYLELLAQKTNGKYLYANDANMLETLIDLIQNSIKNQKVDKIDDIDVTLTADSGFDVKKDGFKFNNFSSKDAPGGNCYGFAYLSKQIYLNQFPTSQKFDAQGSLLGEDDDLIEYSLTEKNQGRLTKGKLYSINIDDGLYDKVNNQKIDLLKDTVSDELNDDFQVIQLINRAYRTQQSHIADLIAQQIELTTGKGYYDDDISGIYNELKTGSPALLSLHASIGNHAVLATKMYKSNDGEIYIIDLYDSNVPGEDQHAKVIRQVPYIPQSGTSYYSFEYKYSESLKFISFVYSGKY